MGIRAPRLILAATASGVGKTTVTCGLLRALKDRGLRVQAAKCGPDYLDPMFHTRVLGTPSRNLDLFLADASLVRQLLADGAQKADLTLIEGVMGYYDGIACGTDASTYALAHATNTPVVLVVDARGRALSIAAEVAGFMQLRKPSHVAGIILNRASARSYPMLQDAIQRETGLQVVGYVPQIDSATLKSRHLGLVAADEVSDLQRRVELIASVVSRTVDLEALVQLSRTADDLNAAADTLPRSGEAHPRIAVARDAAFCFYYEDTLRLLEHLGAQLLFFSPLADRRLPAEASGLYIGGGYPELHAPQLAANEPMRTCVRAAVEAGMPTVAECGGFMYLQQTLADEQGTMWPMAGALPGRCSRGSGLRHFGYAVLRSSCSGLLAGAGSTLRAHEFHYWQSNHEGDAFCARKPQSERSWRTGTSTSTMYAGFPHLYLPAHVEAARRYVLTCAQFGHSWEARQP